MDVFCILVLALLVQSSVSVPLNFQCPRNSPSTPKVTPVKGSTTTITPAPMVMNDGEIIFINEQSDIIMNETLNTDPTKKLKVKKRKTKHEESHEELVKQVQLESVGDPNPETGYLVAAWDPSMGTNPEELGLTYLQGDILMPPRRNMTPAIRNGLLDLAYRWPKGIVVYQISGIFSNAERTMILSAMEEYHKHTCIKFQPFTGVERDYVSIQNASTGCWSTMGRVGGKQVVNLQSPGCLYYIGTVIHELMHTVGFFHEQSRMERDDFIKVVLKNVLPGNLTPDNNQRNNFNKYNSTSFGVKYDYGSVMHYSKTAFSSNNRATIEPVLKTAAIGQRSGFSSSDIEKIRLMYKCAGPVSNL